MGLGFGIRDPESGKNLFRIPDPESMGQKGTGSRIRIRIKPELRLLADFCLSGNEICKKGTRFRTTALPRYITKCIV
jgi:hypothetical protein